MIPDEPTWVSCECSCHAVTVTPTDIGVDLALWTRDGFSVSCWRDRARTAWAALRGRLHVDDVSLSPADARRFSALLLAASIEIGESS